MSVSLVIPNRNNARWLKQCVHSALRQSRPFEEIIVVDDASEDDSVAVIEALAREAPTVRLIRRRQRGGVSRARHAGIEAAQTSHVTTLDADDFLWNPEKNAREWELVARRGAGRPVAAFSDIRRVSVSGADLGAVSGQRAVREGDLFSWLLFLKGFVPRDFTFSKAAYAAAGGYDPGFDIYEDWDLKLRLARIVDFRFTGADGVAYRQNPAGLSRAAFGRHFQAMRRVMAKNTRGLPEPRRSFVRLRGLLRVLWFHRGRLKVLMRPGGEGPAS